MDACLLKSAWKRYAVSLVLLSTSALAQDNDNPLEGEFVGNVSFLSNYLADGISFTDNKPAIQGEMGYQFCNGAYAKLWASNAYLGEGFSTTIEIYPYIGWQGEIEDIMLDVGFGYYIYPSSGETDFNYWDISVDLGYEFSVLQVHIGTLYSYNYFGVAGQFWAPYLSVDVPLPYDINLFGTITRVLIEDNEANGTPDYTHWNIGLKTEMCDWLEVALSYYDTSIPREKCFGGQKICGSGALVSLTHEF